MGKIGLSPVIMDVLDKTNPTLDELMFGSMVIMLLNYLVLKYLMKKEFPLYKHLIIMVASDCAFLINNYVKIYARSIYGPAIGIYGIAFFIVYFIVMFKEKDKKFFNLDWIPSILMGMVYTFGVITFEGFWRVGFWAQDLSILYKHMDTVPFLMNFVYTILFAALAWVASIVIAKVRAKRAAKG